MKIDGNTPREKSCFIGCPWVRGCSLLAKEKEKKRYAENSARQAIY